MMLSCKEIVKIVSTEDRKGWRRKIGVRFHLILCYSCRAYAKQMDLIRSGFKNLFKSKINNVDETKLKDLEDRIIDKIKP